MNLIFRLLGVLIAAAFRPRLGIDDSSQVGSLVLPNDLDLNLHMNNGRYLTVLDLGRLDFLIRAGLVRTFIRQRWRPLIGGTLIRYRFGLRPFQRFTIVTRISSWDEKWFYFEQRIVTDKGVAAIAISKGLARDRNETIMPREILQRIGIERLSPDIPRAVSLWIEAENALHVELDASDCPRLGSGNLCA